MYLACLGRIPNTERKQYSSNVSMVWSSAFSMSVRIAWIPCSAFELATIDAVEQAAHDVFKLGRDAVQVLVGEVHERVDE